MAVRVTEDQPSGTYRQGKYAKETTFEAMCAEGHTWVTDGIVYGAFQAVTLTSGKCPECGDGAKLLDFGGV